MYLEYIQDLPEYPTTHEGGYTYVISADGRSQKEAHELVKGVSGFKLVWNWFLTD
jgi:hypothetical protein